MAFEQIDFDLNNNSNENVCWIAFKLITKSRVSDEKLLPVGSKKMNVESYCVLKLLAKIHA